jgi:TonB-linked SusC/RagA family outer membrane protein
MRYDGTSRFPKQNRFEIFPSVSAGWRISEEGFFKIPYVSSLKLRGSWGKLGNQEIGDYAFINKIDFNSTSAIIGGQQVSGATESFQLANEVIRWETTTSINMGVDSEFFDAKFLLTADYFIKTTDDILLTIEQPKILGAFPPVANAGSVENKGFEIAAGYRKQTGDFKFSINANFSYVRNKITDLGDEEVRIINGFRYETGKSISFIYGFVAEGLFTDQNEVQNHSDQSALAGLTRAGDIKYKDLNDDGVIDNNDRKDLGSYFPSVNYGISANISCKNFDLAMLWQGVGGVEAYVTGRLARPFILSNSPLKIHYEDRAQINDEGILVNTDAEFPRTLFNNPNNYTGEIADGRANSFFVKSSAFLKLRNVQIGYSIPKKVSEKLKLKHTRIYLSGENLLTISKFNYYQVDPEIPSTGDPVPAYPPVTTYLIGLNVTF